METYTMADACPQPAAPQSVPTMTFGKHNGKPISDVPISYVMWLLVDKSTDNTSKRGNYDWIKANDPSYIEWLCREKPCGRDQNLRAALDEKGWLNKIHLQCC